MGGGQQIYGTNALPVHKLGNWLMLLAHITLCIYGHRPSDEEQHQQQAAQPFVYVPTTLTYDGRPAPAPAVSQSGERWMSLQASNAPPPVTAVSSVSRNEQFQHPKSWETGRMMPGQPAVSSETVPSAAMSYAPYQTFNAEQRSGSLPPYVAVSQAEDWKQYSAIDGQTATSDMQRYMEMSNEYYDNRQSAAGAESVGESEPVRSEGLEGSTVTMQPGPGRGVSSSALRQPVSAPGSGKKTVTFHENIATEYAIHQSYGSTSSDSSFVPLSPPEMAGGYDSPNSPKYQSPFTGYRSPFPR